MNICFLLLLGLLLYRMDFRGCSLSNCLSKETADAVKGFSALLVIFHHLSQLCHSGTAFSMLFSQIGYLVVSLFFFYSGYGLMKSVQTKPNYHTTFFSRRIATMLLHYFMYVLLYWGVMAARRQPYTLGEALLSIVNGHPIVYDSWYVLTLLVFYFCFWLMMISGKRDARSIFRGSVAWMLLWYLFCQIVGLQFWWYNSTVTVCFGILIAWKEKEFISLLHQHARRWCWTASALFLISILLDAIINVHVFDLVLDWLRCLCFVMLVLLLTSKVRIRNPFLKYLGSICFDVYLIHRVFIWMFRSELLNIGNDVIWSLAVIALSIPAAHGFSRLFAWLNAVVRRKPAQHG